MAPFKDDITCLASILDQFGEVPVFSPTALRVKLLPSNVMILILKISYNLSARDLPPSQCVTLACLSLTRLKRVQPQYLEDKVAGKLVPWFGKHASMAGRTVLVNVVLTSVVIYFITVLEIPLDVLRNIDSI
jgi:hypothetical protein